MSNKTTRRVFLGTTAPATLGIGLAAGQLFAEDQKKPSILGANDRINIGVIGVGGRGSYIAHIFDITGASQTVAICDLNRKRLEDTHQRISQGRSIKYHDYRKLLENKDVDAVAIATNGHWKALCSVDACKAGKDIYLEKPVGTSISESQAIRKAVDAHKRVLSMGTQQRTWPHYAEAVQIVQSQALGEISHVEVWDFENFGDGFGSPPNQAPPEYLDWDFWVGPSPEVAYNPNRYERHYWFYDYGGGWPLEWGVHHFDIVRWAMKSGTPQYATAEGGRFAFSPDNHLAEWPDTYSGSCEFGPCPVARNGFMLTYTLRTNCRHHREGRQHGKAFYGKNGVLVLDRQGFKLYPERTDDGKSVMAERELATVKPEHEIVQDHARVFLDAVRDRKQPPADIEAGHLASNLGHLMNIAWRVGRKVKWDGQTERIVGDDEANKLVTREYRDPWKLSV